MRHALTLALIAPLTLSACDEMDGLFGEAEKPATITEMQNTCAEELAHRLYQTRADIRVTSTTPTNRGTTGVVVESIRNTESAYCEVDTAGTITSFTRL